MTLAAAAHSPSTPLVHPSDRPSTGELAERFRPAFEHIAAGAVQREREHILPHDEVRQLLALGLGAARVAIEDGGLGASVEQLGELLTELAAADSSIAHVFRATLGFAEFIVESADEEIRSAWLPEIVAGKFFANGGTELHGTAINDTNSRVEDQGDGTVRVWAKKQYSTGNLFADWFVFYFGDEVEGPTMAIVPVDDPGVERFDTWEGFGQQLTTTGVTIVDGVRIPASQVVPLQRLAPVPVDFFQFALVTVIAGSARAALRDGADAIRTRTRGFSHGAAALPKDDPLIQAVVGRLSAKTLAIDSVVASVGRRADGLLDARAEGRVGVAEFEVASIAAHADLFRAQILVYELAVDVASDILNGLAASATSRALGLDRHWRNIRTVASHNPIPYRERDIGGYVLNGDSPVHWASVGEIARK